MQRHQATRQRVTSQELHQKLEAVVAAYVRGAELPLGVHCSVLYSGRNTLYRVRLRAEGASYAIKCFGHLPLWRRIYYSYLGTSKAARSFANAERLIELGFGTPSPIGYQEERNRWGLIESSSFSCELLEGVERGIYPEVYGYSAPEGFLEALALFVASLHEAGVEHLDLSPGNILYRYSRGEGYRFYLVDLNRMSFSATSLDLPTAADNVARLFVARSVSTQFAWHYAEARGWDRRPVMQAINASCDRFWLRRLGKLSRRWCAQALALSWGRYYQITLAYRLVRAVRSSLPRGGGFATRLWGSEEQLYGRYLSAEDIRHSLRHREGYSYTIYHRDGI